MTGLKISAVKLLYRRKVSLFGSTLIQFSLITVNVIVHQLWNKWNQQLYRRQSLFSYIQFKCLYSHPIGSSLCVTTDWNCVISNAGSPRICDRNVKGLNTSNSVDDFKELWQKGRLSAIHLTSACFSHIVYGFKRDVVYDPSGPLLWWFTYFFKLDISKCSFAFSVW